MHERTWGAGRLLMVAGVSCALAACSSAPAGGVDEAPSPPADEAPSAPAAEEAEAAPSELPAGLYTEAQAMRGEGVFEGVCTECHTTSEFNGRTFQADWGRRSVYSFYRTIRSTMPDDNPGGLADQQYLDVTAYILDLNGHSVGPAELSADSPMREFRIDPEGSGRGP